MIVLENGSIAVDSDEGRGRRISCWFILRHTGHDLYEDGVRSSVVKTRSVNLRDSVQLVTVDKSGVRPLLLPFTVRDRHGGDEECFSRARSEEAEIPPVISGTCVRKNSCGRE
jgi:hypothetical protein